jgi:hypothetical protein
MFGEGMTPKSQPCNNFVNERDITSDLYSKPWYGNTVFP